MNRHAMDFKRGSESQVHDCIPGCLECYATCEKPWVVILNSDSEDRYGLLMCALLIRPCPL